MTGSAMKNGRMFRKLCGQGALKNILLVTTHWDEVESTVGESREAELRNDFWKDMIAGGAEVVRFNRTQASAFEILQKLIPKERVVVQLQEEMRDGATIGETSVGKEINKEIIEVKAAAKKELEEIAKEMKEAAMARDRAWEQNLAASKAAWEEQLRSVRARERELEEDSRAREARVRIDIERQLQEMRQAVRSYGPPDLGNTYRELGAMTQTCLHLKAQVAQLERRLERSNRGRVSAPVRRGGRVVRRR
jgi:hypothetical protein